MKVETTPEHYIYTGTREEADKLVTWLMNKGYWIEISRNRDFRDLAHFDVKCGVKPGNLPPRHCGFGSQS